MEQNNPISPDVNPDLEKLRTIETTIAALAAEGLIDLAGKRLGHDEAVALCARQLCAEGIQSAASATWVARHASPRTVQFLAKKHLFNRLVDALNEEGDIDKSLAYARKRGCGESEALDVVVDSIETLIRRGHGTLEKPSLMSFFRKILFEKISDHLEKAARERKQLDRFKATGNIDEQSSRQSDPAVIAEVLECKSTLMSSITKIDLPFRQKAAFLLKDGAGWSSKDVGELLKTSCNDVDVMTSRTRSRMRQHLSLEIHGPSGSSDWANVPGRVEVEASSRRLTVLSERAALLLYARFEMPVNEVAELCEISPDAVVELARSVPVRDA